MIKGLRMKGLRIDGRLSPLSQAEARTERLRDMKRRAVMLRVSRSAAPSKDPMDGTRRSDAAGA